MSTGPITFVQKGKGPTALDADKFNEVIRVVNAIATMQITPDGSGKFTQQGDTAVLDLAQSEAGISARVKLLELSVSDMQNTINATQAKLGQLINSIDASTIEANCNANSNAIDVAMNYPNFPNVNF